MAGKGGDGLGRVGQMVIDLLGTALTLGGLRYKLPRVDEVNNLSLIHI